jgi:hypothetical protein
MIIMMNQDKMTKLIYGVLHFKEQAFKMYNNTLKQDVIEWQDNTIVVGDNVLWLNGELQDDVNNITNMIKATN